MSTVGNIKIKRNFAKISKYVYKKKKFSSFMLSMILNMLNFFLNMESLH